MVSKEDISGSYDIVNLALRVFGVHRLSGNENLGEIRDRGGYKRGKEPIKYESVVYYVFLRFLKIKL